MIFFPFYLLFNIPFCKGKTSESLEANFACKGELTVFTFGDYRTRTQNSTWENNVVNVTVKSKTSHLAVRCRNYNQKPWLIGSVSNGLVTDRRWKCIGLKRGESAQILLWRKTADVSHWPQAFANHTKREDSLWGKISGISEDALWISTVEEDHVRLFCRRKLSDLAPVMTEVLSEGIFQATINDVGHSLRNHTQSQHQVSDVRECFEKCLADPQCLSFNLQHDSALPTRSCELNGVTKGQDPWNYVRRPGYTYYDRV